MSSAALELDQDDLQCDSELNSASSNALMARIAENRDRIAEAESDACRLAANGLAGSAKVAELEAEINRLKIAVFGESDANTEKELQLRDLVRFARDQCLLLDLPRATQVYANQIITFIHPTVVRRIWYLVHDHPYQLQVTRADAEAALATFKLQNSLTTDAYGSDSPHLQVVIDAIDNSGMFLPRLLDH